MIFVSVIYSPTELVTNNHSLAATEADLASMTEALMGDERSSDGELPTWPNQDRNELCCSIPLFQLAKYKTSLRTWIMAVLESQVARALRSLTIVFLMARLSVTKRRYFSSSLHSPMLCSFQ